MLVTIHQPQFMPWLGYFDKMDQADRFVLLDTVQYKKNEWQNRNRLKAIHGPQWLTVPVRFRFPARIDEVVVNDAAPWRHKHQQALQTNYGKAPFHEAEAASLAALYATSSTLLREVNGLTIDWLAARLDIDTERCWASQLPVTEQEPTRRLVEICRHLGASAYLSGSEGRNYLDVEQFSAAGIEVIFQNYTPSEYPQLYVDFVSHMSALDLVLNCGPGSARVMRAGRGTDPTQVTKEI
ncbi:MAG: WbqC family protein [bacterium]|nr:WbqC family protein [bacterium]